MIMHRYFGSQNEVYIILFQVLDEAKDSVTCLQVSDHEILTGSADGRIRRYDIRQGKLYADMIGSKLCGKK